MHNFGTVVRFETIRALKKKSFWFMAIGFPLMFAVIGGIVFMSNKAQEEASKDLEKQQFSVQITDKSGLIKPTYVAALKATPLASKEQGIENVRSGKVDAYFYYPADLAASPIEVYGKEAGMFDNGKYTSVANSILKLSVNESVSKDIQSVVSGTTKQTFTAYKDGTAYSGWREAVLPGMFLVLFYVLISFFGNQMLTSTTEEKENRIIEMILTTIEARTLIIGKIVSLIILALIQALLIFIPLLIGYLLFHDLLKLPSVDLSSLPINSMRIGIAAAIFTASFLLFTGLLVAIGSAVPTAKEASGFFGLVVMLIFGPIYAFPLFISNPESPVVQVLSTIPFTAPIPLLLRNAVGNLSVSEAMLSISLLIVAAAIVMMIAVRVFRYGALEYSRKLSIKEIFARK